MDHACRNVTCCLFYRPIYNVMYEIGFNASNGMLSPGMVLDDFSFWKMVLLVFIQVLFVTMVYGPIAAFLVELFPTQIRYTSMSLPYHIGNGIFGGLLPAIATYLTSRAILLNETAIKNGVTIPFEKPYLEGLWYPISIAAISFLIGAFYIKEKKQKTQ